MTEIGRQSPYLVIDEVLGTGVTCAIFQIRGAMCRDKEKLTYLATIGPS